LCAALVLEVDGEAVTRAEHEIGLGELSGAVGWRYGVEAELPEGTSQLMVIVQAPDADLWAAAPAEDLGEPPEPPGTDAHFLAGRVQAWWELTHPAAESAAAGEARPVVVRLVPPRRQPVTGGARLDALVSTDAVDRVVFRLDGEEVAVEKRAPFAARIDFAEPAREQTVEAVAYDATGRVLGRDVLEVNRTEQLFRVRITGLEGDPDDGEVEIAAEVAVPPGSELDRVELYRNENLVERFDGSFRHRVPTPDVGPEDYLRVAAFLADGTSIDDVVLIQSPTLVEEVDVHLVQLHVVATGADGAPVTDLGADDFAVYFQGERRQLQGFAYADDVPLLLGLVIDTSGSMQLVMHDTRKAAAKFLGTTVLPQDRAFLVDFDQQPRLLHPTTGDLPALLLDLARLQAEGSTALYDAVVFSMLQFEREEGRKALVVLSDGDDYESRFGPRYCVDLARQLGVPIYLIGLGELDVLRRTYSKRELRRVTGETGGRLYFVDSLEELDGAYAQIQAELRSQYSLTFYADRDLSAEELAEVEVRISRPGIETRTVLGGRSTSP
jgi:VWFA-related protein